MIPVPRRASAIAFLLALVVAALEREAPAGAAPGELVAEVWSQVAQVRGLEPRAEVPLEVVDREELRTRLAAELPRTDLAGRRLLVLLGLAPPDLDPESTALDLLGSHATGLYSRTDQRLYLSWPEAQLGGAARVALAHELVHALQDQHFDFKTLLSASTDGDRRAAVRALIEGDAMFTMMRWGRRFLTAEDRLGLVEPERAPGAAELAEAPLVVRDQVLFPYQHGLALVQELHARGGYDAVNRAFFAPPVSTEQVIHPEKYLDGETPQAVVLPPLAGALGSTGSAWRSVRTEVLGELTVRMLIEQFASRAEAEAAAAGWGGDSVELFEDGDGRQVLALVTTWDSDADAAEFYNAYGRGISRRFGTGLRRTLDQPSLVRWSTPIGQVQLLKTGERAILIVAPTNETIEVVAAQFR